MKRFLKHTLVFHFLILVFMCLPSIVRAGGPEPGCDPDNTRCGDPDCTFRVWCPIDKGLVVLLVIGGIYGIKKVYDRNEATASEEL